MKKKLKGHASYECFSLPTFANILAFPLASIASLDHARLSVFEKTSEQDKRLEQVFGKQNRGSYMSSEKWVSDVHILTG